MEKIKVQEISRHRNGVSGAPFWAVRFRWETDRGTENFLATVFDEPAHTAVISLDRIEQHGVAFGENSWRGDVLNSALWAAIREKYPEDFVAA